LAEYLPDVYTDFRHAYPDVAQALDALRAATGAAGPWRSEPSGSSNWPSPSEGWQRERSGPIPAGPLNWGSRSTRSATSPSWPLPPPPFPPQSPGSSGSRRYWRPRPERPQLPTDAAWQRGCGTVDGPRSSPSTSRPNTACAVLTKGHGSWCVSAGTSSSDEPERYYGPGSAQRLPYIICPHQQGHRAS
jgi:hypothetical protein